MHEPLVTQSLENAPVLIAPDGSTIRPLCRLSGLGSFAHFQLEPGEVAKAVSHATVQEIWYIIGGDVCWIGTTGTVLCGEAQDGGRLGFVPVGQFSEGHLACSGVLDHRGSCLDRSELVRSERLSRWADGMSRRGGSRPSSVQPSTHCDMSGISYETSPWAY